MRHTSNWNFSNSESKASLLVYCRVVTKSHHRLTVLIKIQKWDFDFYIKIPFS